MDTWLQMVLTSSASVVASSGFWAYVMRRDTTKSATTRLMMGLAHRELMNQGRAYMDRGWITLDEYEDYRKYLFEPYKELGGNGVAERIMNGVSELPIAGQSRYALMFGTHHPNEEFVNNVRVVPPTSRQASSE